MLDLTEVQERTWANKLAKGFNTTDVQKEILLMLGEIGEAAGAAMAENLPGLGDELADVVIYAACVAKMARVELPDVLLTRGDLPMPMTTAEVVQREFLMLFREGVRVGENWRFQDLPAVQARIDGVITAAGRIARLNGIDLVAAIRTKMDVNDAREYVRDPRSGQMVKAGSC